MSPGGGQPVGMGSEALRKVEILNAGGLTRGPDGPATWRRVVVLFRGEERAAVADALAVLRSVHASVGPVPIDTVTVVVGLEGRSWTVPGQPAVRGRTVVAFEDLSHLASEPWKLFRAAAP